MLIAEAHISSPKSRQYLAQLCKHFGHKVAVEWDEANGFVDFGPGTCRMKADEAVLGIHCEAETMEGLERVKYIVEDHVVRFGWREGVSVTWVDKSDA